MIALLIVLFAGVLVAGWGSAEDSSQMPSTAGPPASGNGPLILLPWCVEVEPAVPIPPGRGSSTPHPGRIRPRNPRYWQDLLRSSEECVRLDGTPVYRSN